MQLLVGLGNPGPKYARHRHNIGFMVLDEIARRHSFAPWRRRFSGEAAEGSIGDARLIALKPMTYMNLSGNAVGEAARFYKIAPGDVIVLHDELDLALGKVRLKLGGGHGGHNGLRDIAARIGADFRRVRIGIGHPGDKALVDRHVLSDFAKAEEPEVEKLVVAIADAAPELVAGDDNRFLNKVSLALQPPKPEKSGSAGEKKKKKKGETGDGV